MLHHIAVLKAQYTYFRFFWYPDNNPYKPIIEYICKLHLVGNTWSPAIANLASRYASRKNPPKVCASWVIKDDIMDPYQLNGTRHPDEIERSLVYNFYVEHFLVSEESPKAALRLIQEGISRFFRYDLKLCKVQSRSEEIREAFPTGRPHTKSMTLIPGDRANETLLQTIRH